VFGYLLHFIGPVWQGSSSTLALPPPEELCQTFFLKELFSLKNKGAGVAPPEEPLRRSRAKHPHSNERVRSPSRGAVPNTPIVMNELVWQNHPRYSRSERSTPYP
jgi:hypothetical protein